MNTLRSFVLITVLQLPVATLLAAGHDNDHTRDITQDSNSLGRLFSTPAQRAYLDDVRRQIKATGTEISEDASLILNLSQRPMTFNGVISRSDRPTEYWVNGRRQTQSKVVKGFNPDTGTVVIKATGNGRRATLKPGQTLDSSSGKIVEPYQTLPPTTVTIENAGSTSP